MQNLIPTNRPVRGEDLNVVRESLNESTSEALWMYATTMTRWTAMTSTKVSPKRPIPGAKLPVPNPTMALLVRALAEHPEACPLPIAPSATEIFEKLVALEPDLNKKQFSEMFGCEASSGYRWITMGGSGSTVQERLFLIFATLLAEAKSKSRTQALRFVQEWRQMAADETARRGMATTSGQTNLQGDARPVIGEDLDALRERLGLSTQDACWLFGMSMTRWMMVAKRPGQVRKVGTSSRYHNGSKDMVSNSALALLVRALDKRPDVCPIPSTVSAAEVFKTLLTIRPEMDKKRFSIMFGCEASSGYRWITQNAKISPIVSRLFKVFMTIIAPQLELSRVKATASLARWEKMVEIEAMARGIPQIFNIGRWSEPELTAARLAAKADEAARKASERAQAKADLAERRRAERLLARQQKPRPANPSVPAAAAAAKTIARAVRKAAAGA